MTRKSSHADKKLIIEGCKLLKKKGASGLSIRELCEAADVNLGMFSYHFKNKENFTHKVLAEIYQGFISELNLEVESSDTEVLRFQMMVMAKFARDNRVLIVSLFGDVLNEEKAVQSFVKNKMKDHFSILVKSLKRCQKHGLLIDAPMPLLITQIVGGIGLSNLAPEFLKRLGVNKAFDLALGVVTKTLTTDKALELRVEITLKGILL